MMFHPQKKISMKNRKKTGKRTTTYIMPRGGIRL